MKTLVANIFLCISVTTVSAQFESLSEKETAKDKLDDYFVQADKFSESFAVTFLRQKVTVNNSTGVVTETSGSGLSIRSDKQRLKYFCVDYDAISKPPIRWRMESFVVGGVERRRQSDGGLMVKPKTVELDPTTGSRAELDNKDVFGVLGAEINPFGLMLAHRVATQGRNSAVEEVIRFWVSRLELKSESELKGIIRSKWNGWSRGENDVGRREIDFDSRVGYLPTATRLFLVDPSGKNQVTGAQTKWEQYKVDRWRPRSCVVSYVIGPYSIEETFLYSWAEPEELELFLAKRDLKEFIDDNKSDWYGYFANFVSSQQDRNQGNDKKDSPR